MIWGLMRWSAAKRCSHLEDHHHANRIDRLRGGYIAYEEAKAHRSNILEDPDFSPTLNQLTDLTATTDDADITGINAQMFAADSFSLPHPA